MDSLQDWLVGVICPESPPTRSNPRTARKVGSSASSTDEVVDNPVSRELTMSIRLTSAKSTYEC
jgi:hypothetical protein